MSCKGFPVFLLILMSVVIGLGGCSGNERIDSKDQIITQKVLDDCEKSDSKNCLSDAISSRTERYCSTRRLSNSDCINVNLEVLRQVRAQKDKEFQETNKEIEIKRKQNAELERQNQEADRVLKK
jgi:hypothetical protein